MSQDICLYLPQPTTFDVLRSRVREPFYASEKIEGLGELDEQLQQIGFSAYGRDGSWIEGSERVTPSRGPYEELACRGVDPNNYRCYWVHVSRWAWKPFDQLLVQLTADDDAYVYAGFGDLYTCKEFLELIADEGGVARK